MSPLAEMLMEGIPCCAEMFSAIRPCQSGQKRGRPAPSTAIAARACGLGPLTVLRHVLSASFAKFFRTCAREKVRKALTALKLTAAARSTLPLSYSAHLCNVPAMQLQSVRQSNRSRSCERAECARHYEHSRTFAHPSD